MAYRIFRHPEVEQDLYDIANLIADFAGIVVAERKLSEIETSIRMLAETPHIGSIRNDIYPQLHAIPTAIKGAITFVVDDEEKAVFIACITYAGADWINRGPKRT